MYINYGDKDFFRHGLLVDYGHSETEFLIMTCEPYPEEEDVYQFGDITVDITEPWIDRKAVMGYIGMKEDGFDPFFYAVGCVSYYGAENFGAGSALPMYDWTSMRSEYIKEILRYRMIDSDNLDVCW